MLALDPPGNPTVGACIAGNLSGPRRHRYGTARDLVLGVTVVLADGTIANSGGKVVKNVAGYDLGKLFCGSRGRFGLIARVACGCTRGRMRRGRWPCPCDAADDAERRRRSCRRRSRRRRSTSSGPGGSRCSSRAPARGRRAARGRAGAPRRRGGRDRSGRRSRRGRRAAAGASRSRRGACRDARRAGRGARARRGRGRLRARAGRRPARPGARSRSPSGCAPSSTRTGCWS